MAAHNEPAPVLDHLFSAVSARLDVWRDFGKAAQAWSAKSSGTGAAALKSDCARRLEQLRPFESLHAFPGIRLLKMLDERVNSGDSQGLLRLAQRVSNALMTRSFRNEAGGGEQEEDGSGAESTLPAAMRDPTARPYFEVLFVTPTPHSRWPGHAQQIRKLRRTQDQFVYEPVFVGSFEDALLAVMVNPNFESVVIHDGIPYSSEHDVPMFKSWLASRLPFDPKRDAQADQGVLLAKCIKLIRPELDVFLLADRKPDEIISDPAASGLRRVFYAVEEPLEIHLSILAGVADRFETPYFDNLVKYAQKPVGTFHALPIARGKSIFRSNWIRDMGEFYGIESVPRGILGHHRRARQPA